MMNPEENPRQTILNAYMREMRETGRPPLSVYRLCQALGLSERDFFSQFSSLNAVESVYRQDWLGCVVARVEMGEEWAGFNARQRMLAFFYALTTAALDERSLLLMRCPPTWWTAVTEWKAMEQRFLVFGQSVLQLARTKGEIAQHGWMEALYPRLLTGLLRSILHYHLRDNSPAFERTDAMIEKSVNWMFDVLGSRVLDSSFDLARFLWRKEGCAR